MSDPLTREALDVLVRWLVAGYMRGTVNSGAEQEASAYLVSGRVERALAAPLSDPAAPLDVDDLAARITVNLNVYQRRLDRGTGTDFDRGKAAAFRVVLGMLDPSPAKPAFSCGRSAPALPEEADRED